MNLVELFDQLYIRDDIAWPKNDRPEAYKFSRVWNLLLQIHTKIAPDQFWNDIDQHAAQEKIIIRIELNNNNIEIFFSEIHPKYLKENLRKGLLRWKETKNVRFNEEFTSFLGIGPASSRRFSHKEIHQKNITEEEFESLLDEDLNPIIKAYNQSRSDAEHSPFKNKKRQE